MEKAREELLLTARGLIDGDGSIGGWEVSVSGLIFLIESEMNLLYRGSIINVEICFSQKRNLIKL